MNEQCAVEFVEAIRTIAQKEQNLENLETYLSHHFDVWLRAFASTPEEMAAEMKDFAEMEI